MKVQPLLRHRGRRQHKGPERGVEPLLQSLPVGFVVGVGIGIILGKPFRPAAGRQPDRALPFSA